MKHRAKYEIVGSAEDQLIIRDIGTDCRSVTNDAENVVKELRSKGFLPVTKKLYYYDSMGRLDEIVHDENGFVTFRPLPQAVV